MARPNAEVITPKVSVYLPICNGLLSWCHGHPWLGELWTASVDVRVCMVTNSSHKLESWVPRQLRPYVGHAWIDPADAAAACM